MKILGFLGNWKPFSPEILEKPYFKPGGIPNWY